MRVYFLVLLTLTVLGACSRGNSDISGELFEDFPNLKTYSENTEPQYSIKFTREQEFGEIYPALLPPSRGAFGPSSAVDNDGNVYIANKGECTIYMFNTSGDTVKTIGRRGRGPGEFESISSIEVSGNGLIVYDANLIRLQVFDIDSGELLNSVVFDQNEWKDLEEVFYGFPRAFLGLGKGKFLSSVQLKERDGETFDGYYIIDQEGELLSGKITETKRKDSYKGKHSQYGDITLSLPYSAEGIIAVGPEQDIYHVNTEDILIQIFDENGEYLRAVYYPYINDPLEEQEVLDRFHPNMHEVVKDAPKPEVWPAVESMLIDDEGRIWVATITNDKTIRTWWVLQNSGELLTKFDWDAEEPILFVKDGMVYTEKQHSETMEKRVIRYKIELN